MIRIAWQAQGAGKPLLLVQGLGYTRHGWGPTRDLLARRRRVISFDNRGIGESDKPEGPYSIAELAADTVSVLDAAGIERADVVGASLGGMVAQEVALTYPERVDRLVLACTLPGGERSYPMPQVTQRIFLEAATLDPMVAVRRFVEAAVGFSAPPALVDQVYAHRLAHPPDPEGWQAQAAAGIAWDAFDRVSAITAPTLVVTGTEDNVVDARNSDVLAERIPNARLVKLEGAGHMLFWERADDFVRIVEEFLA